MRLTERQIAQDLLAALNDHDVDRVVRLFAPSYSGVDASRDQSCEGPEQVRRELIAWLEAFPDLHFTSREVLVETPRLSVCWTLQGTHEGPFLHVPPTGHIISLDGFSLLETDGACFVRGFHLWDLAGMLRAMRLLPNLPGRRTTPGKAATYPPS